MNKRITLGGFSVDVDDALHDSLNVLADRLYSEGFGYVSRDGFDYYASNHPQEKQCYAMALIAFNHSLECGFE